MLSRKTSAPSRTNCRSISGFSLAGPSVQMIFVLRIVQSASVIAASFSHLGGKARSKPRHSLTKTQVRLRVGQTKGDDQRRLLQRHDIVQKRKIKSRPAAGIKLRLEISGGGRLRQHRFRSLERKITAPSAQTANYEKTARLLRRAVLQQQTPTVLLQLGINLFRHFQVLPHCLGGFVGETFHLRIAPVFCLLFECGQILFMIFHHRIHIILV